MLVTSNINIIFNSTDFLPLNYARKTQTNCYDNYTQWVVIAYQQNRTKLENMTFPYADAMREMLHSGATEMSKVSPICKDLAMSFADVATCVLSHPNTKTTRLSTILVSAYNNILQLPSSSYTLFHELPRDLIIFYHEQPKDLIILLLAILCLVVVYRAIQDCRRYFQKPNTTPVEQDPDLLHTVDRVLPYLVICMAVFVASDVSQYLLRLLWTTVDCSSDSFTMSTAYSTAEPFVPRAIRWLDYWQYLTYSISGIFIILTVLEGLLPYSRTVHQASFLFTCLFQICHFIYKEAICAAMGYLSYMVVLLVLPYLTTSSLGVLYPGHDFKKYLDSTGEARSLLSVMIQVLMFDGLVTFTVRSQEHIRPTLHVLRYLIAMFLSLCLAIRPHRIGHVLQWPFKRTGIILASFSRIARQSITKTRQWLRYYFGLTKVASSKVAASVTLRVLMIAEVLSGLGYDISLLARLAWILIGLNISKKRKMSVDFLRGLTSRLRSMLRLIGTAIQSLKTNAYKGDWYLLKLGRSFISLPAEMLSRAATKARQTSHNVFTMRWSSVLVVPYGMLLVIWTIFGLALTSLIIRFIAPVAVKAFITGSVILLCLRVLQCALQFLLTVCILSILTVVSNLEYWFIGFGIGKIIRKCWDLWDVWIAGVPVDDYTPTGSAWAGGCRNCGHAFGSENTKIYNERPTPSNRNSRTWRRKQERA